MASSVEGIGQGPRQNKHVRTQQDRYKFCVSCFTELELFNQELVVVVVFVAVIEVNLFNFRGCCRHLYHFRSRAELDASVL